MLTHLDDHKIQLIFNMASGQEDHVKLIYSNYLAEPYSIAQMHNKKGSKISIAIIDFSKAFDTVPHGDLLSKLKHYGIYDNI